MKKVSIKAKNDSNIPLTLKDVEVKIGRTVIPNHRILALDVRVRPDEIVSARLELLVDELDIDAEEVSPK